MSTRIYSLKHVEDTLHLQKDLLTEKLPTHLQDKFKQEAYIAGGSIYSLTHHVKYKDVDFFIRTKELRDAIVEYFTNERLQLSNSSVGSVKKGSYEGYRLVVTDNAISIGDWQIIVKDYGEPQDVIGQFDFKHNMYYVDNIGLYSVLGTISYLLDNELVYNDNRVRDIVGTIARVPKFVSRGMNISTKEMNRMLLYLNEIGFNDSEIETLTNSQLDQSFGS